MNNGRATCSRVWSQIVRTALVVSLCIIGLAAGSPTGWAATASPPAAASGWVYQPIDPLLLYDLEQLGYSESEIQTAHSMWLKTGVPHQQWLEARRTGRDWLEIARELAPGVLLLPLKYSPEGRDLTEAEARAMVVGGVQYDDMDAVGKIINRYGGDPWEYLRQREAGKSWAEIEKPLQDAWRRATFERDPFRFAIVNESGQVVSATRTGLTKREIIVYMQKGYALRDILEADSRAFAYGLHIRGIEAAKRPEQSLMEAVEEATRGLEIVEKGVVIWKQPETSTAPPVLVTRAGLTSDEVAGLTASGFTFDEILTADVRAHGLGLDLREILTIRQAGESLTDLVVRAEKLRSPEERAAWLKAPPPLEDWYVSYYAGRTGRSEEEIRALRAARRSWIEIGDTGKRARPDQYDRADEFGLKDHILIEKAYQIGLTWWDVRQATAIAGDFGLAAEDVLVMKTAGNTWRDVVQALTAARAGAGSPPETGPTVPAAPPQAGSAVDAATEGGGAPAPSTQPDPEVRSTDGPRFNPR